MSAKKISAKLYFANAAWLFIRPSEFCARHASSARSLGTWYVPSACAERMCWGMVIALRSCPLLAPGKLRFPVTSRATECAISRGLDALTPWHCGCWSGWTPDTATTRSKEGTPSCATRDHPLWDATFSQIFFPSLRSGRIFGKLASKRVVSRPAKRRLSQDGVRGYAPQTKNRSLGLACCAGACILVRLPPAAAISAPRKCLQWGAGYRSLTISSRLSLLAATHFLFCRVNNRSSRLN